MSKELKLIAGISTVPSSHMAERCLIPNQANRNKMVRGPAEDTRPITSDLAPYISPRSREAAFYFYIFLTAYQIRMF